MPGRLGFFAIGVAFTAASCHDQSKARRVVEPFAIVPGKPEVDTGAPKILFDDAGYTGSFGIDIPHQCDLYQQVSVRKVDILWVVDSSGSMAPKQARLAASFQGFMSQLVAAQPPIDFHIGVATTDTDDPTTRGQLRAWSLAGTGGNYIACTPNPSGGSTCNAGTGSTTDAVTAFQQVIAGVGTSGSPQERGLLNAYLVLTNPANLSSSQTPAFVRPDAALYVVIVSDEDDSSCDPLVKQPVCTADPGCHCAPDTVTTGSGAYGSTAYFTRFFESYKGFGNADQVAVAAIIGVNGDPDAGVPSQFGDPSAHVGCCVNPDGGACPTSGTDGIGQGLEIAYYGSRYAQVAAATGGVTVDICQSDFSGALSGLGYAASGLRTDFRLTRGPDLKLNGTTATGIEVYVAAPSAPSCQVDANCPSGQFCRTGKCAVQETVSVSANPNGDEYVACNGSAFENVVHFDGTAVPQPLSAIEICYDILPDFQPSCP